MMSETFTFHTQTLAGQVLADQPQQVPQAAPGGGAAAGGLIVVVILIALMWYIKKHRGANVTHLGIAFTTGVLLAGTVFGAIASQTANSLGTGLTSTLTSVIPANGTGR
jgi:hypothetical protein